MTQTQHSPLDILVMGGGINGVGIANDAAGRGLAVSLCEQGDLGGATSSASSKLIHGGLRYLEHREFRLVAEALKEREILLRKAPHIIWPLRFILPHRSHLRPASMIRAALFLYDHPGKRNQLPGAPGIRFSPQSPLKPEIMRGFEYSDCWVDDARLVVLNALQAREAGAEVLVRTRCTAARVKNGLWQVELEDLNSGERLTRQARTLVNAAGPWVEQVLRDQAAQPSRYSIRMIQCSHLIVPRLNPDERAYILQNDDRRIVFVLPYEDDFSLIGTTDKQYHGNPAEVSISDAETDYLLNVVNAHFQRQLSRQDVVSSFAGVRPLCDDESTDPSAMTRDYTLDLTHAGAPLLSVFGGKITTYRRLAEAALKQLAFALPHMGPDWTASAQLPGGDIDNQASFAERLQQDFPWLSPPQTQRYARSYGTLCLQFLAGAHSDEALGENFGAGLTAAEVDYLMNHEWAMSVEDIAWRRTKLGLRLTPCQLERLEAYITAQRQALAA